VMGEQVYTEKRTNVRDELHLHKRPVTDTEQVFDTVRKERVNVEGVDEQGHVPPDRGGDQTPASQP
jgi:stress response protein YsnF